MWSRHSTENQPTYLEYRQSGGSVTFRASANPGKTVTFSDADTKAFFAEIRKDKRFTDFEGNVEVTYAEEEYHLYHKPSGRASGLALGDEWLGFCGAFMDNVPAITVA